MEQAAQKSVLNHGPISPKATVLPEPPPLQKESSSVSLKKSDEEEDKEETNPLYFTKEGRILFHSTPPTAYAFHYPWPPCPTNLSKNKVFRPPADEEGLSDQVVKEVVEEFQKEANPRSQMSIPDIELAIYWDRHNPFEFRSSSLNPNKRAKSAQNLSQVAELLAFNASEAEECNKRDKNKNMRYSSNNSDASSNKNAQHRRSSSASSVKTSEISHNNKTNHNNSRRGSQSSLNNQNDAVSKKYVSKSTAAATNTTNNNPRIPRILQILNKNEKRQFNDIQPSQSMCRQSNHIHKKYTQPAKVVREMNNSTQTSHGNYKNSISNSNHTHRRNDETQQSIGVQVSLDGVMSEAIKSTYLCPLHGQYRAGIERRNKNGFRTDIYGVNNPHAHCSRTRSRTVTTKLVKSSEAQTDNTDEPFGHVVKNKHVRSKTAPAIRRNRNVNMISEHSANFRNPSEIENAENRKLRNKILSYCFTKHSIF